MKNSVLNQRNAITSTCHILSQQILFQLKKKCDLSNLRNDIMEIGPIPSIMLVREYHIANQPTSHHNQCYEEILSTINLMKY